MNKSTRLEYVNPNPPVPDPPIVHDVNMAFFGIARGAYQPPQPPTQEQITAHLAEMNGQNWKLLNCILVNNDRSLTFFWEKDVLLAEVCNEAM